MGIVLTPATPSATEQMEEWQWSATDLSKPVPKQPVGRPPKPPDADAARQAARVKERLKKQRARVRAAQRQAEAAAQGVAATPAKRGPAPLPDEMVSTK